jgi:hypothetical protein
MPATTAMEAIVIKKHNDRHHHLAMIMVECI